MASAGEPGGAARAVMSHESLSETVVAFALDGAAFAVALQSVRRVLPVMAMRPLPEAPEIALGVINVESQVVPVLDLRRRLGMKPRALDASEHLLVAWTGRLTVAFPVDEVRGLREVALAAVRRAEDVLPGTHGLSGIVALPDELLFIHDLESFLWENEEQQIRRSLEQSVT